MNAYQIADAIRLSSVSTINRVRPISSGIVAMESPDVHQSVTIEPEEEKSNMAPLLVLVGVAAYGMM